MNDRAKFDTPTSKVFCRKYRSPGAASSPRASHRVRARGRTGRCANRDHHAGRRSGRGRRPGPGFRRRPAGLLCRRRRSGQVATVIVIPEVFGMHEYQRDICRRSPRPAITPSPSIRSSASATSPRSPISRK